MSVEKLPLGAHLIITQTDRIDGKLAGLGSKIDALVEQNYQLTSQRDALLEACRQIKLTALTCTDGPKGLAHIVRLCINAGVTEKLPELQAAIALCEKGVGK